MVTMQRRMRRSIVAGARRGVVGAWVAIAFVALAGAAAMAFDIGQLILAAQHCQNVADSAALAAGQGLPDETAATNAALALVAANNNEPGGWTINCSSSDIQFYGPGETVNGSTLGPWSSAVRVDTHAPVTYTFARALGLEGTTVHRHATAMRGPVDGVPICTMWISAETEYNFNQQTQLLMADGPHCAGIPGSFGFLESPEGCTVAWDALLQGYGLTRAEIESSFVRTGDTVYAKTGVSVGHFVQAFESDQGRSRLERAATGDWADDTIYDYEPDNPRIILVPMVSYLGNTGTNAAFRIEKFGAFWLEEVNGGQKEIIGRFIEYDLPGADPDSSLSSSSGLFGIKLVE